MNKKIRISAAVVVVLAVAVLLTGCATSQAMVRTIEVSATAEVTLEPDIASFSVQVSEKADTTKEAQQLANEKMAQVLATLRSNGIEERDLKTTGLSLRPSYVWVENRQQLEGQVASQSLSVKVRTLSDLGKIIDEIGEVSNITLTSIILDKENKEEGLAQARRLAVAKARQKADLYAEEAGLAVASVVTISEYSNATNPYNARAKVMALASEAAYDMATEIPAGTLTLTSTISMVFEMR